MADSSWWGVSRRTACYGARRLTGGDDRPSDAPTVAPHPYGTRRRIPPRDCRKFTVLARPARGPRRSTSGAAAFADGKKASPPGRRLFQDCYGSILDAEITARDQVLEQAADHVARSSDPLGDVLLGEFLRNDQRPVLLDGQRHDQPDQPAVDVGQRQTLHGLGGDAHTPNQLLDQMQRKFRVREYELAEVGPGDDGARRRLHGHHRGRSRTPVERHLADVFTGTEKTELDFPAGFVACKDLYPPSEHDEQRIGGIALVDQYRVLGEIAHHAGGGDCAQCLLGEQRRRAGGGSDVSHGKSPREDRSTTRRAGGEIVVTKPAAEPMSKPSGLSPSAGARPSPRAYSARGAFRGGHRTTVNHSAERRRST